MAVCFRKLVVSELSVNVFECLVPRITVNVYKRLNLNGLVNNKVILAKVVKMGLQLARATAVTAAMPTTYNRKTILRWVEEYNSCFKH